jgi:Bacteriophage Mu Gam like protein
VSLPEHLPAALAGRDVPVDEVNDLIDLFVGDDLDVIPDVAARWYPGDDDAAEWCGRRYSAAVRDVETLRAQAADWHRRIDDWAIEALRRPEIEADYFEGLLARYAEDQRAAIDRKTVALPSVKVATRSARERFVIDDEEALLAWVDDHLADDDLDAVVRTTRKVRPGALGEYTRPGDFHVFDEAGETVPGVHVEPARLSTSITVVDRSIDPGDFQEVSR